MKIRCKATPALQAALMNRKVSRQESRQGSPSTHCKHVEKKSAFIISEFIVEWVILVLYAPKERGREREEGK